MESKNLLYSLKCHKEQLLRLCQVDTQLKKILSNASVDQSSSILQPCVSDVMRIVDETVDIGSGESIFNHILDQNERDSQVVTLLFQCNDWSDSECPR